MATLKFPLHKYIKWHSLCCSLLLFYVLITNFIHKMTMLGSFMVEVFLKGVFKKFKNLVFTNSIYTRQISGKFFK
jgi:hypothetical protein